MNTILFPVDFLENQISQIALPDLKRICRICMGCSPVMSDIFMLYEGQPINEFIMECFPVRIAPGEKLPESICSPCLEKFETIRQFRILCLHSDRVLRNELSSILQQTNSISVLPAGLNGNVEGASTFVDQSGNQVILLTKDNNNSDDPEQQTSTYYILQDSGEQRQIITSDRHHHEHNEGIVEDEIIVPKTEDDLILIEDEDEETLNHSSSSMSHYSPKTEQQELVIPKSLSDEEVINRRRSLTDDEDDENPEHKGKKPKKRIRRRKNKSLNNPEFQFVDINAPQAVGDENLIEILEEDSESVEIKYCERCDTAYQTTHLEHNLICRENYRDCQFCGAENLNVSDFDKHIREQHIKEYRVCANCRQVFLEEKHFLHHFCKHSIVADFDVNVYTCAFCLGTFDSLKSFTHHYYKEHHKKSNCSCSKAS